ncbi:MAG: hypothetical protein GXY68_04260 [Chloroflexi bacterium]|jgi:hypothetical protein|nr:hypothetical protein [Chloroflexota bacterium]
MSTLTILLGQMAAELNDSDHAIWSTDALTAHLRRALHEINLLAPWPQVDTLTPAAGARTLDLSPLGEVLEVSDVWFPCDATGAHPPLRPGWRWLDEATLWLSIEQPADGVQQAQVRYTRPHLVDGLDGATTTSLDGTGLALLVLGATAAAAEQLALARTGAVTVAHTTPDQLARWARERREQFERGVRRLAARRWQGDLRVAWDEAV